MRRLLLVAILAYAPGAAGQTGALPKGDETSVDKGKVTAPPNAPDEKGAKAPKAHRNCFLDLTAPPGGNGHFTADGKTLYLLAQIGGGDADDGKGKKGKGKKKKESSRIRYALMEVSPKTRKSKPVLSLVHSPNASLMTYGDPVEAVSAIAFAGRSAGCFEGPAGVTSISFEKKDEKAVKGSGQFELIESPDGRMLFDQKKSQVLEMDTGTFQTKGVRKVPEGERPLYYDPAKKLLVTWVDDGQNRGLVAYPEDESKAKRLALKKGDRVLQSGGRFGAARLDAMANTLEILEVPTWTKVDKAKSYKLQIPAVYPVASAGVDINFEKKMAFVFGANFLAKQKWQRVLVFNYATGKLLGAVSVTGTKYLNYAGLDPTGTYGVVEIRDLSSRATVGAKVFDVSKGVVDDVELSLPKDDALAQTAKDKKKKKKVKDEDEDTDGDEDGD